jgi:hypothetical protein
MSQSKNEDILKKLNIFLGDETVAGDVAINTAKGHIDVISRQKPHGVNDNGCPKGQTWDKEKKACVPMNEAKLPSAMKQFMNDPLYAAVMKAKNRKEFDKALDTLKSIRGSNAVSQLIKAAKTSKNIKESTTVFGTYGNDNVRVAGSGQTRAVGAEDGEIEVLRRNPRPLKFSELLGQYITNDDLEEKPEAPVDERRKQKRGMSISAQKGLGKMQMDMEKRKKELSKRGLLQVGQKMGFEEWMDLYFPDDAKEKEKDMRAKAKLQNAKINFDAFKKMRLGEERD